MQIEREIRGDKTNPTFLVKRVEVEELLKNT